MAWGDDSTIKRLENLAILARREIIHVGSVSGSVACRIATNSAGGFEVNRVYTLLNQTAIDLAHYDFAQEVKDEALNDALDYLKTNIDPLKCYGFSFKNASDNLSANFTFTRDNQNKKGIESL